MPKTLLHLLQLSPWCWRVPGYLLDDWFLVDRTLSRMEGMKMGEEVTWDALSSFVSFLREKRAIPYIHIRENWYDQNVLRCVLIEEATTKFPQIFWSWHLKGNKLASIIMYMENVSIQKYYFCLTSCWKKCTADFWILFWWSQCKYKTDIWRQAILIVLLQLLY